MTNNKPNDVRVVTVELLEITTSFIESHAEAFAKLNHGKRSEAFDTLSTELRAILVQPPDQQGEPFGYWCEPHGLPLLGIFHKTVEPNGGSHCNVVPLYRHAQPATAKVVLPGRETLKDVMAAVIGGDAYDCTRVWSAWGVGTMTDDDFVPIVEQEERLYELVDACLDEVARLNTPQ